MRKRGGKGEGRGEVSKEQRVRGETGKRGEGRGEVR